MLTTIRLTISKILIMRDASGFNTDSLCLLANYSNYEYGNMQYGKIGLQLGYNGKKNVGISLGLSVCIFLHRYGSSHWYTECEWNDLQMLVAFNSKSILGVLFFFTPNQWTSKHHSQRLVLVRLGLEWMGVIVVIVSKICTTKRGFNMF